MRFFYYFAAILAALILPATAMAQDGSGSSSFLNSGVSILFNAGPTVAFQETVSSGVRKFVTSAAGVSGSVDLGYKWEYVGAYLELGLRAAFAYDDQTDTHRPGSYSSDAPYRYTYKIHKKGEWDGYAGDLGLMLIGFLPVSDNVFLTLGGGGLIYMGTAIGEGTGFNSSFVIKLTAGVNWIINDQIAAGFALNYIGLGNCHEEISPTFSLVYNY